MKIAKIMAVFMAGLSYATSMHAQNEITINRENGRSYTVSLPSDGNYKVEEGKNYCMFLRETPKMADEAGYSITFVGNPFGEGVASKAILYNKEVGKFEYFDGKSQTVIENVPAGKYDVAVEFENFTQLYYVFKEDVEVKEDITLEFNMDEAVNGITYKYYDENNQELYMDEYDYDYNLTREGTALDMVKNTVFAHKEYGSSFIKMMNFGGVITGYEEDFFINDLSDKYSIIQGTVVAANETVYNFSNIITDFKSQTVTNNPANLREVNTKFHYSAYQLEDDKAHVLGSRLNLYYDGIRTASMAMGTLDPVKEGKTKLWIDMYHAEEGEAHDFTAAIQPMCADSYKGEGYNIQYYFIQGCMTTNGKDGGVRYINGGYDTEIFGYNRVNGGKDLQFLPEHPELSFDDKDAFIEYNNCSPILSYKTTKFEMQGEPYAIYKYVYVGRYGETNETYSEFIKPEYEETKEGLKHIVNNYYPIVDGEGGATEAVIFEKNTGDDTTAPALQTLTFKNKDGKITDRFDSKEGVKVIVIGGDYDAHVDTNNKLLPCYFTCKDAKVSLSYSPSYEDNWNDLDVVVIPEKYQWPAFGNFYEASLENENIFDGWYDVKVTIEDNYGNYQTQTLRRAFKMENITDGIMDVTDQSTEIIFNGNEVVASGAAKINIFTVAGEMVASSNNNKLMFNNAAKGVYVVEATMSNGNKINKKIIVK